MIEFFLPFFLGYLVARITQFWVYNSEETKKTGILLKWDKHTLGWRPCSFKGEDDCDSKYMLAEPVDPNVMKFLVDISKKQNEKR